MKVIAEYGRYAIIQYDGNYAVYQDNFQLTKWYHNLEEAKKVYDKECAYLRKDKK